MTNLRWLLAVPVMLAATLVAAPATVEGATIRDRAGMFSKDAVEKAETSARESSACERRPYRDRDH